MPSARGGATTMRDLAFPAATALSSCCARMNEKRPLRLVVPVSLLDRASRTPDGIVGTARCVGAERVCRQILLFQDFDGLEIGEFGVAGILQDQRLGAVADNNPLAMTYEQFRHRPTSERKNIC